ncbi:S8 family peptidase [Streptomyces indicus]|uniref:Subtilase family protein n=1 Tax=Streptomyces indicus TaxID=417292 RepID=A0A1G9BLX8_9ACTN|nr:S8 family peptidase [Streptomyces indicus]SDK40477.1 Subtilase family protein [Streptomyces indicus]
MSTVAVAAAVALAGGMTAPASAAKPQATGQSAADGSGGSGHHRVRLITGDRVVVDAEGKVVGIERAEGREKIPVRVQRSAGHTLVVPLDAQQLIAEGRLDRRLFDVTELSKAESRKAHRKGLKLIVGYQGAAAGARSDVRDAGGTTVRRVLRSLNAEALTTPEDDTPEIWAALTRERGDGRTTASGVAKVWLDGVRKASLDRSVKQIGADKAWAAGYDGKGVRIAVLDTGVDAAHPDLKDQVVAAKNFSASAGTGDKFGHGTHVASIAAGTGAKSGGKYKGVAPGAELLNGKVLGDDGSGDDSGIIAGIDWAVAQGADIINMSLGGADTPGIDPMEAAVNKYAEQNGVLFAVAAGNDGEYGDRTVGSPGSADAALTVGAVDRSDKLAPFSSRGPRVGDGGLKPDVTAPGVGIAAAAAPGSLIDKDPEVAHPAPGYLAISGTSMATPHVAGAAALLKQQHPEWTSKDLKSALTGSAKGGAYTPFQQGTGRIQVDRAVRQAVFAEPSPLAFGVARWPHTDDPKLTKQLTYKNTGTEDVILDLAVQGYNPKRQAAPAGFFTLGATKVTVPAGGTVSVDVVADTKLGGTLDGAYSAVVTASGGGQLVRTAASVQRESESYDVTLKHIGRDGRPTADFRTFLTGFLGSGEGLELELDDASGTVTARVPKGSYALNALFTKDPVTFKGGVDWLAQPSLTVTKDVTLTLDARTAKAQNITVPDASAKPWFAYTSYAYERSGWDFGLATDSFADLRTAHLGLPLSGLSQQWSGTWTKGAATEYDIWFAAKPVKFHAATRHFKATDLATAKVGLGASVPGRTGVLAALADSPTGGNMLGRPIEQKLPGTRTVHLSTANGAAWNLEFGQVRGRTPEGELLADALYDLGTPQVLKAGKTYTKTFNTAVFGPKVNSELGVFRSGNDINAAVAVFSDGQNHSGWAPHKSGSTQLYRNGTKLRECARPLDECLFKVPSAEASYKLVSSVRRDLSVARVTSRVTLTFTFKSKKTAGFTKLPVSVARFAPKTALDSTAPAGARTSMPVTVQGAAAGKNLKSLSVYVSYDAGKNWKKLTVKNGKVEFKNPAKGKSVSFHAKISDKKGNTTAMSVYDAYYGK